MPVVVLFFISAGAFVALSEQFERIAPKILIDEKLLWNTKVPLSITIEDNRGIKDYYITMSDGQKSIRLSDVTLDGTQKRVSFDINYPKMTLNPNAQKLSIEIVTHDSSRWKVFGNKASKSIDVTIDKIKPDIFMVNNSYSITHGGSAIVVFGVNDTSLKELYITTSFGKRFEVTPFYKEGYYVSLLAWPIGVEQFRAFVIATDLAGNQSKKMIRLYYRDKGYKESVIRLKDNFLNGKISDLASFYPSETDTLSSIEKFKFVNETLRARNEELIHKYTLNVREKYVSDVAFNKFYPLRNSISVASFGEHRFYYHKGHQISEAWHMGIDLASTKKADITSSNNAEVLFDSKNGIYGVMPLLYHGLGLYTIYGHCTHSAVQTGDLLRRKDVVARTGTTGLALGDHLHFGVLVQGVEVNPVEWMDGNWVRLNINKIVKDAKKIISEE